MKQVSEGYLPLFQPMAYAQIDFGTFIYLDSYDRDQMAFALTIMFPYSNKGFTQVFQAQNQECLLEGIQRIFQYLGSVPVRLKVCLNKKICTIC